MSVKLNSPTITKLAKNFNLGYGEGLENWFLLYSDIFSQLPTDPVKNEIRRAFFRQTLLCIEETDTLKTVKFINNFPLLWSIISQYSLPNDLTTQKLLIFELKNERVQQDSLIFETLDFIQRQIKFLDAHHSYHKLAPLIDKAQCQRCFNTTKFTQALFYRLINISTATAHNKKMRH